MFYFCVSVICKTQGSVQQIIIKIINLDRNVHKARHVAEIHVEYGQCGSASFDRAYQIRINSRGTQLPVAIFFQIKI